MTKISEYPVIATPELDDLLIGTDANNSDMTKNFSIGSVVDLVSARPYKVYTALLTQTGTNDPVATILENTLGGEIAWSYDEVGVYIGVLNGIFLENKTFCLMGTNNNGEDVIGRTCYITRISNNELLIYTNNGTTGGNSLLQKTPIEIRVYN